VIDALDAGLRAVATRSPLACPLVFAAGLATSLGPCAAPRYVAVAALANATSRPGRSVTLFIAGLVAAYVCLGSAASALGAVRAWSTYVYVALAIVLTLGGTMTLFQRDAHGHAEPRVGASNSGGAFLLGASSALVVSPCCTPIIAGIAGLTIVSGRASDGVALLASFGLGHAAPLLGAAFLSRRMSAGLRRFAASPAPAVVAGTLMLGLAAYFGVLA
jgi:thiol:disulfide interchange protein DsbD